MLSKLCTKVYAIDPTEKLLKLAPQINNVKYMKFDNKKIDLPDKSIDLIFVSLTLGGLTYKNDLLNAISELKRVAKESAIYFIVENTATKADSGYWHYRSISDYQRLFNFLDLELVSQYDDLGEEISIFLGKQKQECLQ